MSVDSGGATPAAPTSGRVARSPRHSGGVGDGDAVDDGVRLPDALGVPVGVLVAVSEEVRLPDALGVGERVDEPLPVDVRVPEALGVGERVCDADGVPVRLEVTLPLAVALDDGVPV